VSSRWFIPRDEKRFEDEIAGVERPERPESLAADYLAQALEYLHDAGDPAALYAHYRNFPPADPVTKADEMKTAARKARTKSARSAVLFAALAGEAYVNEFLAAHGVLEEWDREPTTRKFLNGTEAAYGSKLMLPDREAYPVLVDLYKLRNLLAHPKPGFGTKGYRLEAPPDFERLFRLPKVAEYLIMVAGAADTLIPRAYGFETVDIHTMTIWRGRSVIREYAKRQARLPRWNAPAERQLFRQAGDFLMAQTPWEPGPDSPWTRLRQAKAQRDGEGA